MVHPGGESFRQQVFGKVVVKGATSPKNKGKLANIWASKAKQEHANTTPM